MSKSVKAFIVVSVMLNLLMAGLVLGHIGKHFSWYATFPESKQKFLEDAVCQMEGNTNDLRQKLSEARQKANEVLASEQFDKSLYFAKINNVRELRGQLMTRIAENVVMFSEKLPPQERVLLAEAFRENNRRSHKPCDK